MGIEIVRDISQFKHQKKTAVTVGKFDGLHLGHQLLIKNIIGKEDLIPLLFTFSNSPRNLFNGEKEKMIISAISRIERAEKLGIKVFAEFPFDDAMMHMSKEAFLDMLIDDFNMKCLCVGTDFRFGYKGSGDIEYLKQASIEKDFELIVCPKLLDDGVEISSTYIRGLLENGQMERVNKLLGFDYDITGEVIHGTHLGHTIGIPTINVLPDDSMILPPFGVYASMVTIEGNRYQAVTNIGVKPTVSTDNIICTESHILDTDVDLYGKIASISFKKMLRPEMKFSGIQELKNQMAQDAENARRLLCSLE